jgi:hypothetical protein
VSEDSSSGKDDDVVTRAEAELRAQSLDEPNWEAMAERVMSALPQAGATEAALLEAPLPTQSDETPLDLASSTRVKGAEPDLEFGAQATLDDSWTDLSGTNDGGVEELPFTAVAASTAYVATETAVTESGIVETPAARQGARSERSGERELVSLDELIPGRGRAESDVAASAELGADANLAAKGEHPANDAPESRREAVSLADLARSSVSRRSQDVSSIAKESMAVARTHTGVARRVQAADAAANLPSVMIAPSAADPPTEPPARARPANQGPIIGAAIALVGIAAGFAFYIAGQRTPEPLVITQMVPNAAAPAPVPATATPASPGATEQVEPLTAAEATPVAPTAAEVAAAPVPATGAAAGTPRAGGAGSPQASSRVAPEKIVLGEEEPGVRAEKIVLDEDPTPSAPATKPAPANEGPPLKPAVSSGGLPDRPSAGAVQAAVGSVLGAARSCLAGQLEPSSARVVFASDGSVQAVQVSGPAAGTPAGSCIESAFKKARVQPFAAPTFSFGTKVRPP